MYFNAFDMRDEHDIDSIFPEDAVLTQLNFQDLHEDDTVTELRFSLFQDWLEEDRFNLRCRSCFVAHLDPRHARKWQRYAA